MKGIIFATMLLLLAGCGSGKKDGVTSPESLYGAWELHELNGEQVSAEQLPTIELKEDGTLHGFSGCNILNGSFMAQENGVISFGEMATTRMSCPDMQLESGFLAALAAVDQFSVSENRLTLLSGDKTIALFLPHAP